MTALPHQAQPNLQALPLQAHRAGGTKGHHQGEIHSAGVGQGLSPRGMSLPLKAPESGEP